MYQNLCLDNQWIDNQMYSESLMQEDQFAKS